MFKIIVFSFLLINSAWAQEISEVSSGQSIQAEKLNELIKEVNLLRSELNVAKQKVTPVGSVIAMAGSCPGGYLEADGTSLSRTAYPELFSAISTNHGFVDSNTFRLPDYRGRFLRGVDGNAGNDVDKASRTAMNLNGVAGNTVGSLQGDAIRNITGRWWNSWNNPSKGFHGLVTQGAFYNDTTVPQGISRVGGYDDGGGAGGYPALDASRVVPVGSDNRPKNAYVRYCIKIN